MRGRAQTSHERISLHSSRSNCVWWLLLLQVALALLLGTSIRLRLRDPAASPPLRSLLLLNIPLSVHDGISISW